MISRDFFVDIVAGQKHLKRSLQQIKEAASYEQAQWSCSVSLNQPPPPWEELMIGLEMMLTGQTTDDHILVMFWILKGL